LQTLNDNILLYGQQRRYLLSLTLVFFLGTYKKSCYNRSDKNFALMLNQGLRLIKCNVHISLE